MAGVRNRNVGNFLFPLLGIYAQQWNRVVSVTEHLQTYPYEGLLACNQPLYGYD
jgi:hypothetical protein